MKEIAQIHTTKYVKTVADIVSAYISNNSIRPADLAELIVSVHQTLSGLSKTSMSASGQVEKATLAQIKKSNTPDGVISFINGRPYKSMRRHLATHGHTPKSYRAKYGLPDDYPIVSASYSAKRSALAKSLGLGQTKRTAAIAAE